MTTKLCRTCGIEKPLTEFGANPRFKDGHSLHCNPCNAEYQRTLRQAKKAKASGYIYALADPRTGEIRYIGQTYMPQTRLMGHLSEARTAYVCLEKRAWLLELMSIGLVPQMIILEQTSQSELRKRERAWVNHFKAQGCDLVNYALVSGKRQGAGRKAKATQPAHS